MAIFDKKDLEEMLDEIISELSKRSGKKKIVFVDASSDTTVPVGSSEMITIQPPEGKIWRVKWWYFLAYTPVGATTGTHSIIIYTYESHMGLYANNTYDKIIEYNRTRWTAVNTSYPSKGDEVATQEAVRNLIASYTYPLCCKYTNNTDADQTQERKIHLLVEEEDEAP